MKIDASERRELPPFRPAVPFADGGMRGWKVRVPDNFPLATPAVVDGRLFMGGGFGSYAFYALDAVTGDVAWQYQTEDDGPTAAVVADGCVVFNTESCELEVLSVAGQPLWKKWLGVRAEESGIRRMSLRRLGVATANVCRPLGWWKLPEIFGYLAIRGLPVNATYAMLGGGRWPRKHLRTASIGGERGVERGRRDWEEEYYGDVLNRLKRG